MIDLSPHSLQIILQLIQQHLPQAEVWAFGSRVTWTAKDYSDLDLVLKAPQPLPPNLFFQFQEALDESDLPIKVDVLDWHQISPEFRKNIKQHYEVIYPSQQKDQGSGVSVEWEVKTLGELGSFKNGANFNKNDYGDIYPVVNVKNLFRGRFATTNDLDALKEGVINKIDDYLLQKNDILFCTFFS